MIKEFVTLSLLAAVAVGCATVAPAPLTADDPASPEAPDSEEPAQPSPLLAGSEPLAQWLATNRVDASHSEHQHGHGQHGQAPARKPQQPKQHQHDH